MKQVSSIILTFAFALFLTGSTHAQETPTPSAPVAQADEVVTRNDDSGRWGLLGLLGLAGLAGLMRRPQQTEVRTVDRTAGTR